MSRFSRRQFHQFTVTAFGGIVAGSLAGCPTEPAPVEAPPADPAAPTAPAGDEAVSLLMQEPHVCRGLNVCKNQGASKENACAGQGTCASIKHECAQQNACKGQGGCGQDPGENACKGMGGCSVPLMEHAWESARKGFETAMKAAGKEVGPAPAKAS